MPTAGSIGSPFFFLPAPSSPLARPSASASTAASVPARSAAIALSDDPVEPPPLVYGWHG